MNENNYLEGEPSILWLKIEYFMNHPIAFLFIVLTTILVTWFLIWNGRRICRMYYTTMKYHFVRPSAYRWNKLGAEIERTYFDRIKELREKDIRCIGEAWHDINYIMEAISHTGYGVVVTKNSDHPIGSEKDYNLINSITHKP